MRLNKFLARATLLSRRAADTAIQNGRVSVNGQRADTGYEVLADDVVTLDGTAVTVPSSTTTIMLHKPVGYVVSRAGQGGKTVYDLLPPELHNLKPVGRLDKDSSGLLLLTDDGDLANRLTHPRYEKDKVYEVRLDKELTEADFKQITTTGVALEEGTSKLKLDFVNDQNYDWRVTMSEGRNRQIRRTFAALGYTVKQLHRTSVGQYHLGNIRPGQHKVLGSTQR